MFTCSECGKDRKESQCRRVFKTLWCRGCYDKETTRSLKEDVTKLVGEDKPVRSRPPRYMVEPENYEQYGYTPMFNCTECGKNKSVKVRAFNTGWCRSCFEKEKDRSNREDVGPDKIRIRPPKYMLGQVDYAKYDYAVTNLIKLKNANKKKAIFNVRSRLKSLVNDQPDALLVRFKIGHPLHKMDETKVRDVRKRFADGESQTSLAKIFNVSWQTINSVITFRTWKWVRAE